MSSDVHGLKSCSINSSSIVSLSGRFLSVGFVVEFVFHGGVRGTCRCT